MKLELLYILNIYWFFVALQSIKNLPQTFPTGSLSEYIIPQAFFLETMGVDTLIKPSKKVEFKKITEIVDSILTKAKYGKVDKGLFATGADELVDFIRNIGINFFRKQGELLSIEYIEDKMEGENHKYVYKTKFENSVLIWQIVFDKENKVLTMDPNPE